MIAPVPPPGPSPGASDDSPARSSAGSSGGVRAIRRVAVIGLGLIGGSLARDFAKAPDLRLMGWDADAPTRAEARAAGIPVAETLAECAAGEPDLVVLAVPLAAMASVCRELSPLVGGRTLITDVGSVKAPVREAIAANGLGDLYVGSHPMAGTEASGFTSAAENLFREAAWVLTVDEATDSGADQDAVLAIADLVTRVLGCRVYLLTDDQHDEAVALISHLPHVLAAELLGQAELSPVRDVALSLAAGSFRDATRVAGTNPARTEAMVSGNARWVAPLVEQAAARLRTLATQLRAGDDVATFFAPEVPAPADVRTAGAQAGSPTPRANSASATDYADDMASAGAAVAAGDAASGTGTDSKSGTGMASETDTVHAAGLDWTELRTLLLDAASRGRAIRAIDLRTRTLIFARQPL